MTALQTPPGRTEVPGSASRTLGEHARDYFGRIRGGDMGSLPALLGLIVLCIVFGIMRPVFFSEVNFANLFTQGAQVTLIAMGLVFVLLLGEIDLSAGFASGVCGAIMAILLTNEHWAWYLAIPAAIVIGVAIGFLLGILVAKLGVPSFVVTLAAFLAFQGLVLLLLSGGKNISITDPFTVGIERDNLPPWLGWTLLVVGILGYAAVQLNRVRTRTKRGLGADPLALISIKVGALAVIGAVAVYFLNQERAINPAFHSLKGVPNVVPLIVVLLLVWTFLLGRTTFGRHIYAVGGSKEAARRAGINVDRIRISAFVICSGMAAFGGIVAVSRANSVDPNTGGSNILLYAVGAAVIGGTSLFGGKGRVIDAVLGGAVVAVIDNGMGLMGYNAGTKWIVTGVVLLLAAGVDALSRRRAAASGLR
ncbi:ABC transporter permease [Rugosimonospora acidiphila]|uniref:Xylose transport system permease protein XylH n=1 Tax=Rugosimonospora acidiphila TaxID=556531 RepID=A0ABP9RJ27_9ACTN